VGDLDLDAERMYHGRKRNILRPVGVLTTDIQESALYAFGEGFETQAERLKRKTIIMLARYLGPIQSRSPHEGEKNDVV